MTDNPQLSAALDAAGRGWRIFPVRPDTKRPAYPDHPADKCTGEDPRCHAGHQGFEARATTDPQRIERAWSAAPFNIGVACGPSHLLVVDLDVPKPGQQPPDEWRLPGVVDGADVLTVLAERAGQRPPFDTHTVRTHSGGRHLYFTAPAWPPLRNTAGAHGGLGWLVDTRAAGGYVLGAGSAINSRPYTVEHDIMPAPLPGWLASLLTPPEPRTAAASPALRVAHSRREAYLRAAVTTEAERVATATEGGRNHALFAAAHILGRLVAGGELLGHQVVDPLTVAALQAGLKPAEIPATITSGLRAGANRPRTLDRTAAA